MVKNKLQRIKDVIFLNYNKETNMTAKELRSWYKSPLSRKASLNRKPLKMAIRLKSKPFKKWGMVEFKWALRKAVPYLKRAKRAKGKKTIKGKYTNKSIALKNWGYDVKKRKV